MAQQGRGSVRQSNRLPTAVQSGGTSARRWCCRSLVAGCWHCPPSRSFSCSPPPQSISYQFPSCFSLPSPVLLATSSASLAVTAFPVGHCILRLRSQLQSSRPPSSDVPPSLFPHSNSWNPSWMQSGRPLRGGGFPVLFSLWQTEKWKRGERIVDRGPAEATMRMRRLRNVRVFCLSQQKDYKDDTGKIVPSGNPLKGSV